MRGRDLTTLNISPSRPQQDFVEAEAARSGCTSTREYLRRLIHEAQKPAEQEDLERELIAGLDSGKPIEITPEYREKSRRDLLARHALERT
jgi:hypothetical protein